MSLYIAAFLCAVLFYVGPEVFRFCRSLIQARRFASSSSLPFITTFWYRESGLFWLLSPWFAPLIEHLPFGLGHWVRYKKRDFSWAHKGKLPRDELGSDLFWTVAPGGCILHVSDADVISQITHRWKDFPKAEIYYIDLEFFGSNIVTAEGAIWQRHRRIAGPSFNERNSSLVFQESLTHAKAMLKSLTNNTTGYPVTPGHEPIVEDIIFWLKAITLNVLSGAAFNIQIPWTTQSIIPSTKLEILEDPPQKQAAKDENASSPIGPSSKNRSMSWQHSMHAIMENFYMLLAFPTWALKHSPWKFMRDLDSAYLDFMAHVNNLIREVSTRMYKDLAEPGNATKSSQYKNDLLSNMIRANKADQALTLDSHEILGNICIFIIAGHETSASALETALILLATEPSFQQDIQAELDSIHASKEPGEDLTYSDYPKMRTIIALMLESLRLYPPISTLFKTTESQQVIAFRSREISLPEDTTIFLESVPLHRNPLYFSPDPDAFVPSRWLKDEGYVSPPSSVNESPAHANLLCPKKGSFMAFGAGFRACLGRKFAQVEFCTIIAVLLKDYSIELVDEGDGKSWEKKRNEALECLDRRRTIIALRMLGKVKVRFVKRGHERFPPRQSTETQTDLIDID